ncbi:hypothetical protein Q4503_11955 [Colwellia sp. 6_MG-2023]|uniref:hypothetical protein n=1 Tax=Colwellia sp. 6_MG-2023 TaxID=3062676 RepID=UPI0026E313D1|nr:hypothetical protein [Colwellia sp. 6_MG-2023]MDO6488420.1 hypothetical protein [Colwellia sp. 6_MG-2023]
MAKSPLTKGSKKAKPVRNNKNVVPLNLTIFYKESIDNKIRELDVSHLLYLGADKNNDKLENRTPYLRSFCKKAKEYVNNGNSSKTVSNVYNAFDSYIRFCDSVNVNPFSEVGYLKYAGNDGELRHRVKVYVPSKKLWERQNGDELGIKESSASIILTALREALSWCGLPAKHWIVLHKGFSAIKNPTKGYSDDEEQLLVSRLSALFFALAPQLIAAKEDHLALPKELAVTIDLCGHQEVIFIPTNLEAILGKNSKKDCFVKASAAFNMAMGAAYHLMCFFTSLNDTNVRAIAHPITIHTDERDKNLQTVKVSSFKTRSNKHVDAILTNLTDKSLVKFDVDKRDGVTFIKTLEKLSRLYGSDKEGAELFFTLNNKGGTYDNFNLATINKYLSLHLNLVSPYREKCLPWFKELFYTYRNHQYIKLKTVKNEFGRSEVSKVINPINVKAKATQGAISASYCILSCYTGLSLKGILLPLYYSEKKHDGYVTISFKYKNGTNGSFTIPAVDKKLIQDIEKLANEQADKQQSKKSVRLLLKRGPTKEAPQDWNGISPISSNLMVTWSIEPNDYFISLQSSRWREMTSSQEYDDSNIGRVQSALQNTLNTINKHYANGDPRLNQNILSQSVQVLERMAKGSTLEKAKKYVATMHAIPMLTHDRWLKNKKNNKAKTNPNGITCNGKQNIEGGNNSQRKTNKAMGVKLLCAEYDMCYKCKSAKAVDDVQAIYKLISFIDALKEVLDRFPDVKENVFEKIDAYEYTLDGASISVYEEAMALFNKHGRHARVSINHAILSMYR